MSLECCLSSLTSSYYYLLLGYIGYITSGIKSGNSSFTRAINVYLPLLVELNKVFYWLGVRHQTNFDENPSNIQPFLFSHYWLSFADLLRDPVPWDAIAKNLGLQLVYAAVFGSAAWARLTTRDVTA